MNMRNKPCQCNSEKKYKKCCGNEATLNEARRVAEAHQMELLRARAAEREREQQERVKANPRAFAYRRQMMPTVMLAALALGGLGGGGNRASNEMKTQAPNRVLNEPTP